MNTKKYLSCLFIILIIDLVSEVLHGGAYISISTTDLTRMAVGICVMIVGLFGLTFKKIILPDIGKISAPDGKGMEMVIYKGLRLKNFSIGLIIIGAVTFLTGYFHLVDLLRVINLEI